MSDDIHNRKKSHIEIASSERGRFARTTTLLDEVTLVHQGLPELSLDEIDTSIELFGRRLSAPLMIGAMTGGTNEAARINKDLAGLASSLGIGFCLGSQRIMVERPETESSFQVRDVAPNALIVGNIGVVQARAMDPVQVSRLVDAVGADAMAVHVNPAHELIQADGDRDFRGCVDTTGELASILPVPVIVKETGCGLSRQAAEALVGRGVLHVEVGGAGGTSWVKVEKERQTAQGKHTEKIGDVLGEWGIPTAASLSLLSDLPLTMIAGGGIRDGLDMARAVSLGATACAVAQPVLAAYRDGGVAGVRSLLEEMIGAFRAICLLTGSANSGALRDATRIIGPNLERWRLQGR